LRDCTVENGGVDVQAAYVLTFNRPLLMPIGYIDDIEQLTGMY
jgi:hypothetical protein